MIPTIGSTFSGLASTGHYYLQIASLNLTPTGSFVSSNWESLVSQIMGLLNNPIFYGIILVVLVISILPGTSD